MAGGVISRLLKSAVELSKITRGELTRPLGIWVAFGIYLAVAIYGLVFPLVFDRTLFVLLILAVASLATAAGLFLMKRLGFWIGLVTFPLLLLEMAFALYNSLISAGLASAWQVALFNASLVAIIIGLVLALLLIIDKRKELEPTKLPFWGGGKNEKGPAKSAEKKQAEESEKKED